MEKELSCVDCGTQNCKYKDRTYPDFCLTTGLDDADWQWAVERYDEGENHRVMVASAEVELSNIPAGVRSVRIDISPVGSGYNTCGGYSEETEQETVRCNREQE